MNGYLKMIRTSGFGEEGVKLAIERRKLLEEAADGEGLVDNVFWIPPLATPPYYYSWDQSSFPMYVPQEADIVTSVAGAIQRMRADPQEELCLKADFPQPRVLAPGNFLRPFSSIQRSCP